MHLRQLLLSILAIVYLETKAAPPGSLIAWGDGAGYSFIFPPDLKNVIQLATGAYAYYALQSEGRVRLVSSVNYEVYKPPLSATNIVQISASGQGAHVVARRNDGTVLCWGAVGTPGSAAIINAPPDLSDVVDVAAGATHSIALKADGTIVTWGDPENYFHVLNAPSNLTNVTSIAAGWAISGVVLADGSIRIWGATESHGLPDRLTYIGIKEIAFGSDQVLLLRTNGTVVTILGPAAPAGLYQPPGLTNVVRIWAGSGQCAAIKSDETLVMWGWNNAKQATPPKEIKGVLDMGCPYLQTLALIRAPALQPGSQVYVLAGDALHLEAKPHYDDYTYEINWTPYSSGILTLTKTNMQAGDAGDYSVSIRNAYGTGSGRIAQVTVLPSTPRVISMAPREVLITPGQSVNFSAVVAGTEPIFYEWRRIRFDAPSETVSKTSSLNLSNVFPDDEDENSISYQLTARNFYGPINFDPVVVRFNRSGYFQLPRVQTESHAFLSTLYINTDRDYRLEVSDDLKTWNPIMTFRSTTGSFLFADNWSAFTAQRFYRLQSKSP